MLGQIERQAWQPSPLTPKRKAGRWLQRERAALFQREPLCRECAKVGRTSVAMIRDHITPLFEGGKDVESNIQPLCQRCSDAKTAAESNRGRGG
jgi:5-methylcytosine-specific restriction protein A